MLTDSFKGALSSADAGEAMASGIRRALAEADAAYEVAVLPVGDGGEGTAEAVGLACRGERCTIDTTDLFGHPVDGVYYALPDHGAVFDMATCAGIGFAKQHGPDPMRATTAGVGLMLNELIRLGYKKIYVGLGGSGTNDGGIGALAALGARFYDAAGALLDGAAGGQLLAQIQSVDVSAVHERLSDVELNLLYDVAVPLTGETGATRMFGRQKGATPEMLDSLEAGMYGYARAIAAAYGAEIPQTPGTGAAGGLGCGLHLAGGKLCHGAGAVLDLLDVPGLLRDTVLVFTGEGKTDVQTAQGKLPHTVARYAKAAGVPCVDICGQADPVEVLYRDGMTAVVSLVNGCISVEESMGRTAELAGKAAYDLTRLWLAGRT